jgi:hypothetical protein
MAITTETVRMSASPVIVLKGRGKALRELAYMQIAPLSFIENISRVESIANLRSALGVKPGEAEIAAAQSEWIIGRVASRLPAGEFPAGTNDDDAKLEFARKVVLHYAAPPKEGAAPRKLRAGQLGRRSATQHKVCMAAKEAWSQVNAELGHGTAKTQAERNASKATRSTNANAVRGDGKGATGKAPTHGELVAAPKPTSEAEACQYVESISSTLLAFANKHAKKMPVDYGAAVQAFRTAILAAANAREVAAKTK